MPADRDQSTDDDNVAKAGANAIGGDLLSPTSTSADRFLDESGLDISDNNWGDRAARQRAEAAEDENGNVNDFNTFGF